MESESASNRKKERLTKTTTEEETMGAHPGPSYDVMIATQC